MPYLTSLTLKNILGKNDFKLYVKKLVDMAKFLIQAI